MLFVTCSLDQLFSFSLFFFFSSRRRHTRSYGDWSSDVCSSDLSQEPHPFGPTDDVVPGHGGATSTREPGKCGTQAPGRRSEERRVGKECRSRGAREQ